MVDISGKVRPKPLYDMVPILGVPKRTQNSSTPSRVIKIGFVMLILSGFALIPRVVLPPIFFVSSFLDDFWA